MPALVRRAVFLDDSDDEEFNIHTTFIGPSGSSGQGILKPPGTPPGPQPRRLEALSLETTRELSPAPVVRSSNVSSAVVTRTPVFTNYAVTTLPKMEYYSTRSTYGHGGDDYLTSGSARSRALVSNTLDDNDVISRRSRLADQRVLSNISQTMNALNEPLPRTIVRPLPVSRPPPVRRHVPGHVAGHVVGHVASYHPPPRPVVHRVGNVRLPPHRPVTRVVSPGYIYPITSARSTPALHHVDPIWEEPTIYEVHRERIEPIDLARAGESIGALKRRAVDIKNGLGSQRILLDRYMPIEMGPAPTVDQGINKKYFELAVRMPNLEPETYRKRTYLQDECSVRQMTPRALRSQSVPRHVGGSVPAMSETRKNIRKLITKTRRDPGFYD